MRPFGMSSAHDGEAAHQRGFVVALALARPALLGATTARVSSGSSGSPMISMSGDDSVTWPSENWWWRRKSQVSNSTRSSGATTRTRPAARIGELDAREHGAGAVEPPGEMHVVETHCEPGAFGDEFFERGALLGNARGDDAREHHAERAEQHQAKVTSTVRLAQCEPLSSPFVQGLLSVISPLQASTTSYWSKP